MFLIIFRIKYHGTFINTIVSQKFWGHHDIIATFLLALKLLYNLGGKNNYGNNQSLGECHDIKDTADFESIKAILFRMITRYLHLVCEKGRPNTSADLI